MDRPLIERISVWSYSMYVCHMLVYDETRAFFDYDWRQAAGKTLIKLAALGLIFVVSALNFRYFERPLTSLRERFGRGKRSDADRGVIGPAASIERGR